MADNLLTPLEDRATLVALGRQKSVVPSNERQRSTSKAPTICAAADRQLQFVRTPWARRDWRYVYLGEEGRNARC
jgi:hypothetical protein